MILKMKMMARKEMKKMGCNLISRYKGSKASNIRQMIDEKLKKKFEKEELPKLRKDRILATISKRKSEIESQLKSAERLLEKRLGQLGLCASDCWSDKKNKRVYTFNIPYGRCFVPKVAENALRQAEVLKGLGKHKEANNILDALILQYDLVTPASFEKEE